MKWRKIENRGGGEINGVASNRWAKISMAYQRKRHGQLKGVRCGGGAMAKIENGEMKQTGKAAGVVAWRKKSGKSASKKVA
jgi:hypothetical protein